MISESVYGFGFMPIFWAFEQIFASLIGGYINFRILPPINEAKICQKSSKKRRNRIRRQTLNQFLSVLD
jgi:hypothetical protein